MLISADDDGHSILTGQDDEEINQIKRKYFLQSLANHAPKKIITTPNQLNQNEKKMTTQDLQNLYEVTLHTLRSFKREALSNDETLTNEDVFFIKETLFELEDFQMVLTSMLNHHSPK